MANKEMEVVKGLDLKRYMGRWYEIACYPSRFQPSDGVNTRATYTLRDDGTVHVLNETWSGGKRSYIEGTAFKADPNSDEAKLKPEYEFVRKTHLDDETYNELVQKAKDEGYDVSKLHKTPQSDPPPEQEGPQDTKGIWWFKSLLGK
ncbi:Lipocalin/cytosolic fatty-acid binding domain [Sesbania bispinosa]|nr:Lipocalin/cytosolic fatty-acid binding domain [Sesbania bispinosa]